MMSHNEFLRLLMISHNEFLLGILMMSHNEFFKLYDFQRNHICDKQVLSFSSFFWKAHVLSASHEPKYIHTYTY